MAPRDIHNRPAPATPAPQSPQLTIEILTGPPATGKTTYAMQQLHEAQVRAGGIGRAPDTIVVSQSAHLDQIADDFAEGHFGNDSITLILDSPLLSRASVLVRQFIPNDNSRINPDKLLQTLDNIADPTPPSHGEGDNYQRTLAGNLARQIRNGDFK